MYHVFSRFAEVKRKLESTTSKYVLVKEAILRPPDQQLMKNIPSGYRHVFLIRDPTLVYHSYRKAKYSKLQANGLLSAELADKSKYDIEKHDATRKGHNFFKYLHELWGHVRENVDPNPIVINTQDLLDNPKRVLSRFCELTGLPYQDSLLQWDASNEVVKHWRAVGDNVTYIAMSFYGTAINSSKFLPPSGPLLQEHMTEDVIRLADASFPFYKEMNKHRII